MGELKSKVLEWVKNNRLIITLSIMFLFLYLFKLYNFPIIHTDDNLFSNPAYILVTQGKLGTTLMYGFYNMQNFTYWQPPVYILLLAVSFKLLGLGVIQGRLVSVSLGFITMIFTYLLGKEYYNKNVGIIAASIVTFNLLIFYVSRTMRMEIAVACFTVISIFLITLALKKSNMYYYFLSGIFSMLTLLSHPNGLITIITVYMTIFVWKYTSISNNIKKSLNSFFKEKGVYLYSLALIVTSIPYLLYISLDFASFKEQFTFNVGSSIFNPISNVLLEPNRYVNEFDIFLNNNFALSFLEFSIIFLGVVLVTLVAVSYARKYRKREDTIILTILISQMILFGILVYHKFFIYLCVMVPFWAILIARSFYNGDSDGKTTKNLFKRRIVAILILAIVIIPNLAAIGYVLSNNYDYYSVEVYASSYIPHNATIIGDLNYYMAFANDYNYYALPLDWSPFHETEYDTLRTINPDYIICDRFSNFTSNTTIEYQTYINENYKVLGVIAKNKDIYGSPVIIYEKINKSD